MSNSNLTSAKRAKNDEFYTQQADIAKEVDAYTAYNPNVFKDKVILLPCDDPDWSHFTRYFVTNFERLGLKKLISTSYAADSNPCNNYYQPNLWETNDPKFDLLKTRAKGKIFTLTKNKIKKIPPNIDDLEWDYLKGDGDFRSLELKKLRDGVDIVITNPPFSLFREFLAWIVSGEKKFLVIGNINAITYKEVFPLIKANRVWLGATGNGSDMVFKVPPNAKINEKDREKAAKKGFVGDYTRLGNSCWFTNLEHGKRHELIKHMSMADNLKYNKKIEGNPYQKYDNYDAIEIPYVDAIPSDYAGVMGVPITFLDKYCPEQFEIVRFRHGNDDKDLKLPSGKCPYFRILIRHKSLCN